MFEKETHLGTRIPVSDKKLLQNVCSKRGENMSTFVRRAIRKELASLGYFEDEIRKALGVRIE